MGGFNQLLLWTRRCWGLRVYVRAERRGCTFQFAGWSAVPLFGFTFQNIREVIPNWGSKRLLFLPPPSINYLNELFKVVFEKKWKFWRGCPGESRLALIPDLQAFLPDAARYRLSTFVTSTLFVYTGVCVYNTFGKDKLGLFKKQIIYFH